MEDSNDDPEEMSLVHSVSKFPSMDKGAWAESNAKMITDELSKYKGLFAQEEVAAAFQDLLIEYLYLQNVVENVAVWRDNFLKFIADAMETAETEIARRRTGVELQKGRLTAVRDVLEWF